MTPGPSKAAGRTVLVRTDRMGAGAITRPLLVKKGPTTMTVVSDTRDEDTSALGLDERDKRAQAVYERRLRPQVETPENIGGIIVLAVASADYDISEDETSIAAAHRLQAGHPGSVLYAFRIGYNAVDALGGVLERTTPS